MGASKNTVASARQRVLMDLFGAPITLLPLAGGAMFLILSWAVGGSVLMGLLGAGGIIAGLGTAASRLYLHGPELIEAQKQYEHEERLSREEQKLDALDQKLTKDRDPRTQTCLREIRELYRGLQVDVKEGKIGVAGYRLLETVEELFKEATSQLELSWELFKTSKELRGKSAKKLAKQREEIVVKCEGAAEALTKAVEQFHLLKMETKGNKIDRLQDQLDRELKIAKEVGRGLSPDLISQQQEAEFEKFMQEE